MIAVRTKSAEDTRDLARAMAPFAQPGDLVLLAGDVGTGKTTFTQGFGDGLGVTEQITSPTFILMRRYDGRLPLVHVDVYRLEHLQEVLDLGLMELLDDGAIALIEWGDVVAPALPANFLEVRFDYGVGDDDREARVRAVGPQWGARLKTLSTAVERWRDPAAR